VRLPALVGAAVELAEAEVAVGDERAHAAGLGEARSATEPATNVRRATVTPANHTVPTFRQTVR
jgi:hypothetical protein